jgi:2-amino-4-hydroxy-6-hydroxymethyldihydropteridine diphosphokinase
MANVPAPERAAAEAPLDAVVGLGSNLGDRVGYLSAGLAGLARLGRLTAVSSLYETAPLGPPQPAFLNAAARLSTTLSPSDLLQALLAIERDQGRIRRERWGPRTLDLDLLWIHGRIVDLPDLTVPHPGLPERAFALVPLIEVVPGASDHRTGVLYSSVLAALPAHERELRRLNWPGWPPSAPAEQC